jgi:hypothetical protein
MSTDIIHALPPEAYRLPVLDKGWQSERYERWSTDPHRSTSHRWPKPTRGALDMATA